MLENLVCEQQESLGRYFLFREHTAPYEKEVWSELKLDKWGKFGVF